MRRFRGRCMHRPPGGCMHPPEPPLHELEEHHLGRVACARTELEDPRVAAGAALVARRDDLEELADDERVLAERRERLAASVEVAALGERDQLLDLGLDRLGLRLGRLDPLVLDDLLREVGEQRAAMIRVAAELVALFLVAHRDQSSRRCSPRASSVSMTSSIDFLPKLGIAFSSASDLEIRSPTVWMPARLRQL